jgi:hypothetical protein
VFLQGKAGATWLALALCCSSSQRVLVLLVVLHSTCVDMDVDLIVRFFPFSWRVVHSVVGAGGGSRVAYNMPVTLSVRAFASYLDRSHSTFLLTLVFHHEA